MGQELGAPVHTSDCVLLKEGKRLVFTAQIDLDEAVTAYGRRMPKDVALSHPH